MTEDKWSVERLLDPEPEEADFAGRVGDVLVLMGFLLWHEPDDIWGGVRAGEAFEAACRIVEVDPQKMKSIIRA